MIYTVTLNPAVDRELRVPSIEFDTVLRASEWRVDYGGKGFNVSRMLMSLGMTSKALGFAGGRSGELLRDGLESLGIQTEFVWVDGETRTNVSIVGETHDHYVKVNEPGPTISSVDQAKILDQIRRLARPNDWWVLAGSLPPGVPSTFYADIIAILCEEGAFAVLDSSGDALRSGIEAGPFLVKPNDVEAGKLTGQSVESEDQIAIAGRAIQEIGAANVIISLGKRGAILVDAQNTWMATSPAIKEHNPIGAGDSMVGGLVWGLCQGYDVSKALRWGIACGAATASQDGTAVGSLELVETLVDQLKTTLLEEPNAWKI